MNNPLYVISTPIGNLADLTARAQDTLEAMDIIFCEDTRVTGLLLKKLNLKKKLLSCHAHNEQSASRQVIEALQNSMKVAYVSDAGTPGLSDPGNLLVQEVSQAGLEVCPIPGVSALSCLLGVCGFNLSKGFHFAGFLPRKKGQLIKLLETNEILFGFESPYRIRKSLSLIAQHTPQARLCLGRELTKFHEEVIRGAAIEVSASSWVEKGEFVLGIWQRKTLNLPYN